MKDVTHRQDFISNKNKKESIKELIDFFKTERNTEIGIIAAEDILNHFLENVGMKIYNKGVEDSINIFKERVESLELDIESLLKK
ncbi:MAG: DUF2164 domain-containing protein [Nanoarchaeota archaeon]|nr:DUF2164 domain-containing protein [Nanoarchaeota archaeon]